MEFPDLVPELKEIIVKLVGPTSEELGIWLREKVRFLRFKSSIKVFNRAKEKLIEAGFSEPKPVDLKTLIPLLENCSLENEDSELIEKWAGLLSSAIAFGLKNYSYPHILKQLSPEEAKELDLLYKILKSSDVPKENWWDVNLFDSEMRNVERLILFYNLKRLGLIEIKDSGIGKLDGGVIGEKSLNITPLGADFVEACRGPLKK